MRAGGSFVFGSGTLVGVSTICESQTDATSPLLGNLAAPDLLAGRPSRQRGVPVRGLAQGCRAGVGADSATRPARRVRLAVPRGIGLRRVATPARRAGCTR